MRLSSITCLSFAILLNLHIGSEARRSRGRGRINLFETNHDDTRSYVADDQAEESPRNPKLFPLFNLVVFKNDPCVSTSTSSTGSNRKGTCYTSGDCSSKSGTALGNCAAGFGVCCVFFATSGTVSQNCTYLRNAGFPSSFSGTSGPTFTIKKCSSNICQVRLDFESFTITGPTGTAETLGGNCATDSLTFSLTTGESYPTICGQNTGQHVYLDLGSVGSNTASLAFTLSSTATGDQIFEIKVSQIPCGSTYTPPTGCFQYFTGFQGTFSTFNFLDSTTSHLASQQYTACIRQEVGYCCVEYTQCADANAMSINVLGVPFQGAIDASCDEDYLIISGASDLCISNDPGLATVDRICSYLTLEASGILGANGDIAICDCVEPFEIGVRTDNTADANTGISRGSCLNWRQLPC